MDDETHIGFVDSHTKGYSSHNNVNLLHKEIILSLRARCRVETCMIGSRLNVIGAEDVGKIFHLLARKAIYNTTLTLMLTDKAHYILVNILRLRPYLIIEVGTIERTLILLGIHNAKTLFDIGAHLVGGCGCKSYHRSLAYLIDYRTDTTIFGTKIMSPLRDTVCLVNGIERYLHRLKEFDILFLGERLGCNIKQLAHAICDVTLYEVDGGLIERRIDVMRNSLVLAQIAHYIHLVLHQRNKRRYNDGSSFHQQGRQLIT